jgi:hypothetical protein
LPLLSKLADWLSIAGVLLSAAGLVVSTLAFRAAKKARQSADEARRDVRTLVAADKFHYLGSRARELSSNIENENFPVAAFLAADLRSEITSAIARWEFLDSETREGFKQANLLALQVLEVIRKQPLLDPRAKNKVLRKCDSILAILSGESGKIQSGIEGGGGS